MLIEFCLIASAKPVEIGGDFGRAWISHTCQIIRVPFPRTIAAVPGIGGNAPKVQGTVGSNIVSQQNATNPITPSTNWLGGPASFGNQLSPQNFTQTPLFILAEFRNLSTRSMRAGITQHKYHNLMPMVSYMGGMPKGHQTRLGLHLIISKS